MKNRLYLVCGVSLVAAGLGSAWVWFASSKEDAGRFQRLEDGSLICLRRISLDNTNVFTHGNWLERNLGNVIPKQGIKLGPLRLQRRTFEPFPVEYGRGLMVEFKRLTNGAPAQERDRSHPPRRVRCLIVGGDGSAYPAVFQRFLAVLHPSDDDDDLVYHPIRSWGLFESPTPKRSDGEFEYLSAPGFPRGSAWLEFRFETCNTFTPLTNDLPWEPLASFRIKNPFRARPQPWQVSTTPVTNEIDGLRFVLGDIKIHPTSLFSDGPMERESTISLAVQSNGVALANWRVFSLRLEDALGSFRERGPAFQARNGWLTQRDRLRLDSRQTWKVEADLAAVVDKSKVQGLPVLSLDPLRFDEDRIVINGLNSDSLCTIRIPLPIKGPYLTNVHKVPLRVAQAGGGFANGQKSLNYQISVAPGILGWRLVQPQTVNGLMFNTSMPARPLEPGLEPVYFSAPDGAPDFEATFVLVKNYHLEFFVRPKPN